MSEPCPGFSSICCTAPAQYRRIRPSSLPATSPAVIALMSTSSTNFIALPFRSGESDPDLGRRVDPVADQQDGDRLGRREVAVPGGGQLAEQPADQPFAAGGQQHAEIRAGAAVLAHGVTLPTLTT